MKKIIIIFVSLFAFIVLFTVCNNYHLESNPVATEDEKPSLRASGELAWDYPMRYGAPGWEALQTMEERMLPVLYSLWTLAPTAGICANIIEKENAGLMESKRAEVNYFMHSLMSSDIQFLDYIVELSENIH